MQVPRYLTESAKAEELAAWARIVADLDGIDGPGVPDQAILPWCDKLNAIFGACTLQSCAGHVDGERGRSGHLWLWLDEVRTSAFRKRVFELAGHNVIERVSMIYQPWGQEIIEIKFQGNPDGQLEVAMQEVLGFLISL